MPIQDTPQNPNASEHNMKAATQAIFECFELNGKYDVKRANDILKKFRNPNDMVAIMKSVMAMINEAKAKLAEKEEKKLAENPTLSPRSE